MQRQAIVHTFWLSSALFLFCCISFSSHRARSSGKKSRSAACNVLGVAPLSYLQHIARAVSCLTAWPCSRGYALSAELILPSSMLCIWSAHLLCPPREALQSVPDALGRSGRHHKTHNSMQMYLQEARCISACTTGQRPVESSCDTTGAVSACPEWHC